MFLDKIVATKLEEVAVLKQSISIAQLQEQIAQLPPTRGFEAALSPTGRKRGMGLIAEVKKASPSKGLIRADFDPVALATSYARAGADCISVLTDVPYFQGADAYLQNIRRAVDVPLLRKDFTIDALQIYEARALGADAILLIAAILTDEQMASFLEIARAIDLDVLIEVHDEEELRRVLPLRTNLIGVNNRDLRSFETRLSTTAALRTLVPKEAILVSESGISSREDVAYLAEQGAGALLIGEHFMRQPDAGQAIVDLLGAIEVQA